MEETLGKRIAAHRKSLGLTQDALAEQLGITAQAVSKWENDQSCPDITMIPRLAGIFNCTTDELLGIIPKQDTEVRNITESASNIQEELLPARFRKALDSPGAPFGFWLFLTGVVALIDAIRLPPYDLVDISLFHIAISCGIFSFGLFSLLHRFSLLRLGCTLAGGAFIFNLVTEPSIGDMNWYVPLLAGIALFGLDMFIDTLINRKQPIPAGHRIPASMKNHFESGESCFACVTAFGEDNHLISLPILTHGQAEVHFGEMTLDLTGCRQFAENCQLELRSSFGEMNVLIPRNCRIESSIQTAFAAFDSIGTTDPDPDVRIYVNGNVSFGHIRFRYI